jgi:hypothetical protein
MAEFAKYYLEFVWTLLQNIGTFFSTLFSAFSKAFWEDIKNYFITLADYTKNFDILGWICLIVATVINILLVYFLIYRFCQLIRRYIFFRSKEVDKDELMEELARLKKEMDILVKEKAQILSMKVDKLIPVETGGVESLGEGISADGTSSETETKTRFAKLTAIDEEYKKVSRVVDMTADDMLSLKEICERFVNFAASQLKLYYTIKTVRLFISAMGTSKIIILEGISGTGKTSLPYAMAKFFSTKASIVSVQPSWRDRAELLGYLNEFTKRFNETDFLASVYEATYREDINYIVLDEMNLARIEYYFAEFLSIMEMPDTSQWKIDLIPNPQPDDPRNLINGKILVPQNIWFIGTANQDDSTFNITDKVYDRAVSIDLNTKGSYIDAPITESIKMSYDYLESLFVKAQNTISLSQETLKKIELFDEFIRTKFKISFGNRILKQIKLFIPVYIACGGEEYEALDFMIMSKVLRKFTSLNLVFLIKELNELSQFLDKQFGRNKFTLCQNYIKQLQKNI